jgi:hypothetical protein
LTTTHHARTLSPLTLSFSRSPSPPWWLLLTLRRRIRSSLPEPLHTHIHTRAHTLRAHTPPESVPLVALARHRQKDRHRVTALRTPLAPPHAQNDADCRVTCRLPTKGPSLPPACLCVPSCVALAAVLHCCRSQRHSRASATSLLFPLCCAPRPCPSTGASATLTAMLLVSRVAI